jgi:hypothetical protein
MAKLLPSVAIIKHPLNAFTKSQVMLWSGSYDQVIDVPYPPADFGLTITHTFSRRLRRGDWVMVECLLTSNKDEWSGKRMRAVVFSETGYTGDHPLAYAYATQRLVVDGGMNLALGWALNVLNPPDAQTINLNVGFTSVGLTGSPPFRLKLTAAFYLLPTTKVSLVP